MTERTPSGLSESRILLFSPQFTTSLYSKLADSSVNSGKPCHLAEQKNLYKSLIHRWVAASALARTLSVIWIVGVIPVNPTDPWSPVHNTRNVRVQQRFSMFMFYRLFHRCVHSTPSDCPSDSSPEPSIPSDPQKDRAIIVWLAAFGISLLFRPVAELVIRIIFFSACALLIGTLDSSLNFLVEHPVLRAAKYDGYESPLCRPWKPDRWVESS